MGRWILQVPQGQGEGAGFHLQWEGKPLSSLSKDVICCGQNRKAHTGRACKHEVS